MPPLCLSCDWRDTKQQELVVRFIVALRKALDSLDKYYSDLGKIPSPKGDVNDFCLETGTRRQPPYPKEYKALDGDKKFLIKYIKRIFPCRLIYYAKLEEEGRPSSRKSVIVKFTQRYGQEAHLYLMKQDLAPAILYCDNNLAGGWRTVVMDYLPH